MRGGSQGNRRGDARTSFRYILTCAPATPHSARHRTCKVKCFRDTTSPWDGETISEKCVQPWLFSGPAPTWAWCKIGIPLSVGTDASHARRSRASGRMLAGSAPPGSQPQIFFVFVTQKKFGAKFCTLCIVVRPGPGAHVLLEEAVDFISWTSRCGSVPRN